jgi:hypothetical protein
VETAADQARIPESFFEHRQMFAEPWIDRWIIPNPFISALLSPLRNVGVELADFSFNKDASNVAETYLNISIRKLKAGIRVGLDTLTFIVANPVWEKAPELASVFDRMSTAAHDVIGSTPLRQEAMLAFHVTPGVADFGKATSALVDLSRVGESLFYGVSLHRSDGTLAIDKSLKYEGAAFVRLQRQFGGDASFSEVALRLYEDEVSALRLLGIFGVPMYA